MGNDFSFNVNGNLDDDCISFGVFPADRDVRGAYLYPLYFCKEILGQCDS